MTSAKACPAAAASANDEGRREREEMKEDEAKPRMTLKREETTKGREGRAWEIVKIVSRQEGDTISIRVRTISWNGRAEEG